MYLTEKSRQTSFVKLLQIKFKAQPQKYFWTNLNNIYCISDSYLSNWSKYHSTLIAQKIIWIIYLLLLTYLVLINIDKNVNKLEKPTPQSVSSSLPRDIKGTSPNQATTDPRSSRFSLKYCFCSYFLFSKERKEIETNIFK